MNTFQASLQRHDHGVTMVEVLVAALLIFLSLGSILAMNTRSIHLLRATKQAVASSQVLQQRIETIRDKAWPEIASAAALAAVMRVPTDSEKELADGNCTEFINISVPGALGGEQVGARAFSLRRQGGVVEIIQDADLGAESMLLVSVTLQWRDVNRPLQRTVRTVICRNGLTRSGIFGSVIGRPPAPASHSTDP